MFSRFDGPGIIAERITQRLESSIRPRQRWFALALWTLTVVIALILNLPMGVDETALLFFIVLHGISVILSVRLPGGVHVGLINTSLAAGALAIGYRPALLIAPLTSLIAIPPLLALTTAVRRLRRYRDSYAFETMWYSGAQTLALLMVGWLYSLAGGPVPPSLLQPSDLWRVVLFIMLYVIVVSAFTTGWLRLCRIDVRAYWRRYWSPFISSGLVMTLLLAPIMATSYEIPQTLRLVGLMPYSLGALLLFNITRTQLRLTDRAGDLRTLNNIGRALNASLKTGELLSTIHAEIDHLLDASSFYLALVDPDESGLRFPLVFEQGEQRPPETRAFANGLPEHIIRTRQALLINYDVGRQASALGLEPPSPLPHSYVGVPIVTGEHVIGVMALRNYALEFAYDRDDLQVLETIASSAAVALQNAQLYEQSQRQAEELSTLNQVSNLVSSSLELDTVLDTICRVLIDRMACQKSAVFLHDAETGIVSLARSVGLSDEYRTRARAIPVGTSLRAQSIRAAQPITIEDVSAALERYPALRLLDEEDVQALLEVPLRSADRVIGSLAVYYRQSRRFEPSEVELLHTLAGQVAMALDNAQLFASTNARHRKLETLYQTGRAINASLSLPSVLNAVTHSMIDVLDVEVCVTLLSENNGQVLRSEVWMERDGDTRTERESPTTAFELTKASRLQRMIHRQETIVLDRASLDEDSLAYELVDCFEIEAGIGLPLVTHGDLLGVILVGYRKPTANFRPDTLQLARALADQATLAIHNARLFENTDVALTRRVDELAALEVISQRMTRRLELQTVIEQVVKAAAVATGAEVSELLLLDDGQKMLIPAARVGHAREREIKQWPAEDGVVGRALRTGKPAIVGDVTRDTDYVSTLPSIRAELAVPIVLEYRQLGVINLESTRLNAFDADQARFISNLAEHAAIAIQNAQLFETIQKRADEFQTLRSIAVDLLSSLDFKHTLRVIARQALSRIGAKDIHIYLYDQATEELTFGTSLWQDGKVDVEFSVPRPDGVTATVARNGERLIITNPDEHPLFEKMMVKPGWSTVQTMVSVPLKRGNEVLGVFNIAFDDRSQLTENGLHFLDLLASQAAVAIANARLAEQTRTGRDRLQAILDSIHDGILMFDIHGKLVLANPRVEYLLGVRIDDYLNQHYTYIIRKLSKEHDAEAFSLDNAVSIAREIGSAPTTITRRDYTLNAPSFRVINEMSIPVTSLADQLIGRLFILRDVTSEHEMEAYRQEMSNMIVHDLRSPLAGVITGLNLALDESEHIHPNESQEMITTSLRVALQSSNTLLRLVEGMLDVNKLEMGEVPLRFSETSLCKMAERAIDMLKGTAAEADIELRIVAAPNLAPIRVDADKLERVFVNLLDNALRYTPEGGQVRIEIEQSEEHQQTSIIDTGEGIPPELRERVFERFYQGDVSRRKRGVKGTGLGLTFCRLVIEAHGGRIWVGEGPEGGAAVRFTLPLAAAESGDG